MKTKQNKKPLHHIRYARAWDLYQDRLPDSARQILEKEMDSAQNDFEFQEFLEFKKTLKGFEQYWDDVAKKYKPLLQKK